MKFLHVIPPHAVNAYKIIKLIRTYFPEDEHSFLIMATKDWVINNRPRLLAFLDLNYLPEANKKVFSKISRLRTTMAWINEADRLVLHSAFSIHGKLFIPCFCRKKYAKKCIWIETYTDLLSWKHSGKGIKAHVHNYILERFLRSIPSVGVKLLSDECAYQEYVGGSADFFLTPYPMLDLEDLALVFSFLEESSLNPNHVCFSNYQQLFSECEESFQRRMKSMGSMENELENLENFDDKEDQPMKITSEEENSDCHKEPIEYHMLMVEGDMLPPYNQGPFFKSIMHLKSDGLLAVNLHYVGKHCYSSGATYRRTMYRAGEIFLGRRYIDFKCPHATKEFFLKCISKVEGIAFFSKRTLNPQFIWLMLLMNKKVFLPEDSPLYKYLKENQVPVFPYHFLREMTMEQFTRPIRTDGCEWIQTFVDEKKIAACWEQLFLAVKQKKEGTR